MKRLKTNAGWHAYLARCSWPVLFATVGWASLQGHAAFAHVPPPPQEKVFLIEGAVLHTISGAPIENGRMLVNKGRIEAIGAADTVAVNPGVQRLNLNGGHIYPGWIAANTSLGLTEIAQATATVDTTETGAINPNARAVVAVNADSELLPVARANGVLAALAAPRGDEGNIMPGTSALIVLDGWNWEEMSIKSAVGLHVVLPSLVNPANRRSRTPMIVEEMRKKTAQTLKVLESAFESAAAYQKAQAADTTLPKDTRWEAMRPFFKQADGKEPLPVFIAADELAQIRYALALADRFGLKIVIVGGADAWRIAPLLNERKVPVIITATHRLPQRRGDDPDTPFRLAARLFEAGVTFAIARGGSPFDAALERNLPYEAATAVAHGLPADQALRAISLYPARILGVDDQIGSLEVGKLANFIVTDGDPLDIRTQVKRVFIRGRELPLEDRQTRLRDKYAERYRQLKARQP